ncbi:MAG: RNA-binding protein [Burkholderiales bacterium]|nr:RNA-binding protein [Burkholderiales bacterium]
MTTIREQQRYSDIATVRRSLGSACARFGRVRQLDVLLASHDGGRQAVCFVRMETMAQEQAVMDALGIRRFEGVLGLVLDLGGATAGRATVAAHERAQLGAA